ncbi:hypothetical protein PR048_032681 [Dryococelus australis]|uniref:Alpha-2-macroglobulin RAP C-terminal domain-containing protein n=1 Tax=Dryococelus australis TaxID=614101 RepID=A0ABQ9G2W2_9NEOP|nr:hypothetical protein PR048_032681 [Dryococelus australis]
MSSYGLLEHFEDVSDPKLLKQHKAFNDASDDYINKSLFKDKKLNKLWLKAEKAGFKAEELSVLKEEFMHHQDKIDQYYTILTDVESRNDSEARISLIVCLWFLLFEWGFDGRVVSLPASHQGKPGSIPGQATPSLSRVGIVLDDAAGQRVFSGISRFLHPFILALLHTHFNITLIGFQDLDVKSHPHLFTHFLNCTFEKSPHVWRVWFDESKDSVDDTLDKFNRIEHAEEGENVDMSYLHKANLLRERHKDIRNGYDRLHRIAAKGPKSKEFIEPRVEGLWRMAIEANFTPEELESLRGELLHYENRVLKLRHMQAEAATGTERHKSKEAQLGGKTEGLRMMEDNLKKQMRKVEKLHVELEAKIMQRHVEL